MRSKRRIPNGPHVAQKERATLVRDDLGEICDAGKIAEHRGNQCQAVSAQMSLGRHDHDLVKKAVDSRP